MTGRQRKVIKENMTYFIAAFYKAKGREPAHVPEVMEGCRQEALQILAGVREVITVLL